MRTKELFLSLCWANNPVGSSGQTKHRDILVHFELCSGCPWICVCICIGSFSMDWDEYGCEKILHGKGKGKGEKTLLIWHLEQPASQMSRRVASVAYMNTYTRLGWHALAASCQVTARSIASHSSWSMMISLISIDRDHIPMSYMLLLLPANSIDRSAHIIHIYEQYVYPCVHERYIHHIYYILDVDVCPCVATGDRKFQRNKWSLGKHNLMPHLRDSTSSTWFSLQVIDHVLGYKQNT